MEHIMIELMTKDNIITVPVTDDDCSYDTEYTDPSILPVETLVKNVKPTLKRSRPTWNLDETDEADDERRYLNNVNEKHLWVLKLVKNYRDERMDLVGKHMHHPNFILDLNERPEQTYLRIARVKAERKDLRRLKYSLKPVVKRIPK